jgi:hypothetical protein
MTQFQPSQYEEEAEHEESMRISYEDPASRAARLRIMSQLAKASEPPTPMAHENDATGAQEGDEAKEKHLEVQAPDTDADEPLKRIKRGKRRR